MESRSASQKEYITHYSVDAVIPNSDHLKFWSSAFNDQPIINPLLNSYFYDELIESSTFAESTSPKVRYRKSGVVDENRSPIDVARLVKLNEQVEQDILDTKFQHEIFKYSMIHSSKISSKTKDKGDGEASMSEFYDEMSSKFYTSDYMTDENSSSRSPAKICNFGFASATHSKKVLDTNLLNVNNQMSYQDTSKVKAEPLIQNASERLHFNDFQSKSAQKSVSCLRNDFPIPLKIKSATGLLKSSCNVQQSEGLHLKQEKIYPEYDSDEFDMVIDEDPEVLLISYR